MFDSFKTIEALIKLHSLPLSTFHLFCIQKSLEKISANTIFFFMNINAFVAIVLFILVSFILKFDNVFDSTDMSVLF